MAALALTGAACDRAFISNVHRNNHAAATIRGVIGLARGLNLPLVAKGVESEDQLAFVPRELSDEVQGYLIARPGPIESYDATVGRAPQMQAAAKAIAARAG